ncbi:MAG: hypothetical protein RTU30_11290 [Candidatus Thorarchaeota archaeon]
MRPIETKIKAGLRDKGIKCQSVFKMYDLDENRVLLSFNSQDSQRLSTRKIERILNSLGMGEFKVPNEFQRLSASFLHLEVTLGARTERHIVPGAF